VGDLPFSGFALVLDGSWVISRETLASLLGMGGVHLPPRSSMP
jgi:hypothetical protein